MMKEFLNNFNRKNMGAGILFGFGFYMIVKVFRYAFLNEAFGLDSSFFSELWKFAVLGIGISLLHQYNFGLIKNSCQNNSANKSLVLFISLSNGFVFVPIVFLMRFIVSHKTIFAFYEAENIVKYLVAFFVAFLVSYTYYYLYINQQTQKQKIREQTFLAGSASAKFDALKNQLDPHFLFNSLNVLTGLIEENPEKAQDFTTGLSKVYRYVLEQKDKEWVPVDEELDFARTYLQLLQMRFENSLQVKLPETPINSEYKMVPLSLQLLLENAVKHNEASPKKPLYIKVYESDGKLVVENNFQPKENLGKSSGFGLTNIRQRYGLLTDMPVEITQILNIFSVSLPLLTHKKSIMQTKELNQSYLNARKRLDDLKEFYGSLLSYVIVIPFLIFINYRTYWGFQWFWFPMLGWGIGLAIQATKVYFPNSRWEQRKFEQFLEEERRKMKQ